MKGNMIMSITATTQTANRFGLNLKIWAIDADVTSEEATPVATIDFANEVSVDLSGDMVWATGGQSHANKVPFSDPMSGTITISTQLLTTQLLAIVAGKAAKTFTGDSVIFNNNDTPQFYQITGETVWKDKSGVTYTENIHGYKVTPNRAYNVTYTGEGDPTSMDIVFNMTEDDDGNVYKSERVDKA